MPNTFALIIPTYQGGSIWRSCLESILNQNIQPSTIIVIDSGSSDDTIKVAMEKGITPITISKEKFNHGGTRNFGVSMICDVDFIIFMTQDAILDTDFSFFYILKCFEDNDIAAVCGRQVPHYDSNPLAVHARFFNYPSESCVKSISDCNTLGLKVVFMSNSFSAYRRDIFERLGGFPDNTILSEDMFMAAKMLFSGHKIAYCADAVVRHSHNYTPIEEFKRYFDIGVFHACEKWIQKRVGGASGEGLKFVKSELSYLWNNAPLWIPRALVSTVLKLLGYKLGKNYKMIPSFLWEKLSMYKGYWLNKKHDI